MDVMLEARGEDLGNGFHDAILQGNRMEITRRFGAVVLRKENQESTVNTREINAASVEIGKHGVDVVSDEGPEGMVEGRPKAIWPRACILVHSKKSPVDLFLGERQ
jgi:hypothetical protein